MVFENVGYNGPHLANFSFSDFKKEVRHHFEGKEAEAKMKELYDLIRAKYKSQNAAQVADIEKPDAKEVAEG